jgi:hypothetical protein
MDEDRFEIAQEKNVVGQKCFFWRGHFTAYGFSGRWGQSESDGGVTLKDLMLESE